MGVTSFFQLSLGVFPSTVKASQHLIPTTHPVTGNRPRCSHSLTRPPSDPLGFSTQSLGLHCPCCLLILHLAFLTLNQTTNSQIFSPPATSRPQLPTKSPLEALPPLSFKTASATASPGNTSASTPVSQRKKLNRG